MHFAIVLTCTIAFVWLVRKPLRRHPSLFYILAALMNALYLFDVIYDLPVLVHRPVFILMQKCTLSLAFFTVVMFIGTFSKSSKASTELRPVRTEMSIIACILCIGHVVAYAMAFAPRLASGTDVETLVFLITAIALIALIIPLGVTSIAFIKQRMAAASWKKLQRLAYVFFGLIYVHMTAILLPTVLAGASVAAASVGVYTILFGSYTILRIRRMLIDRSAASAS